MNSIDTFSHRFFFIYIVNTTVVPNLQLVESSDAKSQETVRFSTSGIVDTPNLCVAQGSIALPPLLFTDEKTEDLNI